MIDWHSHILPGIDDGSKSTGESLAMLRELSNQNIETVVATPHFYANLESKDSFIEKRNNAYSLLTGAIKDEALPNIVLGAEVRYYQGISRLNGLSDLAIGQSKLILIEMPTEKWTEYTISELLELSCESGLTIVLAHVERYFPRQSRYTIEELYSQGILAQVNANSFLHLGRRKALSALRDGKIHFIGSDCHNMTSRPPLIGDAFAVIKKKFGEHFISQMNEFGYSKLMH